MILDLPDSSTREVGKALLRIRDDVGAMAMGRVLTLLVVVDDGDAEEAVRTAGDATRQHPARIVVVDRGPAQGAARLDAQIRVGGDAGASEIVVLRLRGELTQHAAAVVTPLLLPDSPIVAWWPGHAEADVAGSPLGAMAQRRITDATKAPRPAAELLRRAESYRPGDTDLAWTRVTRWRALLAAALESALDIPVVGVVVAGEDDCPSCDLVAGWLALALGCPVTRVRTPAGTGLVAIRLDRGPDHDPVDLVRTDDEADTATLTTAERRPRLVALHTPSTSEALAEELRRLDADEVYGAALQQGVRLVHRGGTRSEAVRAGLLPGAVDPAGLPAGPPPRRRDTSAGGADAPGDADAVAAAVRSRLETTDTADLRVHPDKAALAAAVVDELVARVEGAVAERGVAHVVLTGGSMGTATMAELAARARAGRLERPTWRHVHLWWGDERFVASGDADRNDAQAEAAGLGDLPVLAKHVHRVPSGTAQGRLELAAERYAAELATWAAPPDEAARHGAHPAVPAFDVVMLGVGPDAHVASLFPGRPELRLVTRSTAAVADSPKPPPLRVTLTVPALSAARAVWMVVAGEDKAAAVSQALTARDDHELPASCVRGRSETVWWVDDAAAAEVRPTD